MTLLSCRSSTRSCSTLSAWRNPRASCYTAKPAGIYGQDAVGLHGGVPDGLHVHPRIGLGAGAKVHRRGLAHGARAVRDEARGGAHHHLHGRDRLHRRGQAVGGRRGRQQGAAHKIGADAVGRFETKALTDCESTEKLLSQFKHHYEEGTPYIFQ